MVEFIQQYGGFIFLAAYMAIIEAFKAWTRRTVATTQQTETATALLVKFNDDRNLLIEKRLEDLSGKLNFSEGQRTQAESTLKTQVAEAAATAARTLDKEHKNEENLQQVQNEVAELKTTLSTDLARISTLEGENKDLRTRLEDLNKTIVTLTDENKDLKTRFNDLFERFILTQATAAAQAVVPPLPLPITETNNAAIAAESKTP